MRHPCLREDTRDAILDASSRLIERFGYKKMTMDDVAREAGVGKGTIYLYFRSKEEVALSCADRITARVLDRLRSIAHDGGSPAERIRRMLVERVLLRFDSVRNYAWSLDELFVALRPAFLARRDRWQHEEAAIFAAVLAEGRHTGNFAACDSVLTALTLLLATNALMPLSLSPKELGSRDEVEEKAGRIADLLLRGLVSRAEQTARA
jgi:AcrR family transcriptional regulator